MELRTLNLKHLASFDFHFDFHFDFPGGRAVLAFNAGEGGGEG